MNNIKKFHETIGILVEAYLSEELAHGTCAACAVGNIISRKMGTKPKKKASRTGFYYQTCENGTDLFWGDVFRSTELEGQLFYPHAITPRIQHEISVSGYSLEELRRIEYAFENAPRNCPYFEYRNEEWMFNGLMAVVDVLAEIHGVDLSELESVKLQFVKS